jgi:phage baseplate assembly protein W|tara:strand:- start:946 stop:1347 length:402 start_codon:yes stop_codon:yes gene_type:complete
MANETVKKSRIYQDLDLSFTATDSNDVGKKLDVNAAKQALRILINTNFYERPFDPGKAANLRGYLFEPMSKMIATSIATTIENVVTSYEPRVKIESISVIANFDTNAYDVSIMFFVVGINKPQKLTANLKRLR